MPLDNLLLKNLFSWIVEQTDFFSGGENELFDKIINEYDPNVIMAFHGSYNMTVESLNLGNLTSHNFIATNLHFVLGQTLKRIL